MTAMDEYQDIRELLKPKRTIGASAHLRQRIGNASVQKRNTVAKWLWVCSCRLRGNDCWRDNAFQQEECH